MIKNSVPLWVACGFLALAATGAVRGSDTACQVKRSSYRGWQAVLVSNPWLELFVVAKLGGRLMQVNFGGHDWFPTRFPAQAGVRLEDVTEAGIVTRTLAARAAGDSTLHLTGSFGVLWPGVLVAHFYDPHGALAADVPLGKVDPLRPVALDRTLPAARAARISLHLEDQQGVDRGRLGEVSAAPAQESP